MVLSSRSYPPRPENLHWRETPLRSVLPRPLEPPPVPAALPPLPCAPRTHSFAATHTLSTHIVPAAFPRAPPDVALPPLAPASAGKDARKKSIKVILHAVETAQTAHEHGAYAGRRGTTPLWACVNRYRRKGLESAGGKRGLTLVLMHAGGYTKEIWEPSMHHLVSMTGGDALAPDIDEIWSFDAVTHGDSALLNENALSGIFDWMDVGRDILHFMLYYLPSTATSAELPTHLPRLPDSVAESRKIHGFTSRTVVSIGHSFGGTATTLAAISEPALADSLILVDPAICPRIDVYPEGALFQARLLSTSRKVHWSSSAQLKAALRANPYFASWDPAALDIYVSCAFHPDPASPSPHDGTGPVVLKMAPVQEAILYESRSPVAAWKLLPALAGHVPVHFIMAGRQDSIFACPREVARDFVHRRSGNVSNCIVEAGHLIPHEIPKDLADEMFAFLATTYGQATPDASQARL